MKIKKGDKVKILVGKDRGKVGKVITVLPGRRMVTVEGLNLLFKNVRARRQGEKGQRIQFPAPLSESKVALVCPKCGKPTRVGRKVLEDKTKVRVCRKCTQTI